MMIDFYASEIGGKIGDYVVITMGVGWTMIVMVIVSAILSCQ